MGLFDSPTETRTFTFHERVALIELKLDAAEIELAASDDDTICVEIEESKSASSTPPLVPELIGTKLRLERGIVERVNSRRRLQVRISAPRGVSLGARVNACKLHVVDRASDLIDIQADAGSIRLERITGTVRLRGNAVKADLSDVRGDFDATTNAGSLVARGLDSSAVRVALDVGRADLQLVRRPSSLEVRTNVGSVDVSLPAGAYNVAATSNIGSVKLDGIDHDGSSPERVTVDVSVGKVRLSGVAASVPAPY